MSTNPQNILELEAAEQRRQLHSSVDELRDHVRESFDLRRNARKYLAPACAAAGFVALLAGYSFAGLFTKH